LLRPVNRVLGAWRSLLRPADHRSRDPTVPAARESPSQRSARPIRLASRPLHGASGSSASGGVRSAASTACWSRRPAPSPLESLAPRVVRLLRQSARPLGRPGCSRRSRRRPRRNSSAGFRNRNVGSGARRVRSALDPLAPEPDSSSREPSRRVRHPICRLRRRIYWLRRSMRHRVPPPRRPSSRNRSYHRSAAVPSLRHWPLIRPAASCPHAPARRLEASFYATRETHS
jgi:hypothetical protein